MDIERINLNDSNQNRLYIILTVILVILSIIGIILFFQIKKTQSKINTLSQVPTITPTSIPTEKPSPTITNTQAKIATPSAKATPSATLKATITPKATATVKLSPSPTTTPTPKPTVIPSPTVVPTITESPTNLINLEKTEDGFSVTYSNVRKLYQDTESSGNRYTFSSSKGNFAVHVGTNGWSWTYPDRQFSSNFLISGKPTFRYDVATQTIVDVENNNIKYTIQCVHNGNSALKTECEEFINSFKLL